MIFVYLLILTINLVILNYIQKILYYKKRGLPAPLPSSIFGLEMLFKDKSLLEQRKENGKIYGTFLGDLPLIIISEPEIAKIITIKESQNFNDTNPIKINMKYIKDSFFLKKNKEWKDKRTIISPVFTTKRIKNMFSHFRLASKPFFENIENLIKEGKQDEIDIKDLLKGYSLDVIGKFVYALELNSAKDHNHPFVKVVRKLVDFDNQLLAIAFNILPKKLLEYLESYLVDQQALEYLANLTRYLIKERSENKVCYNDFLGFLIKTIEEKRLIVSEDEIIGNCMIFIFVGLETVSLTITNALYCLALNQEYQKKLYDELIELYPDKEITYENIHNPKLLDAILKESQRLFPTLKLLLRIFQNPMEIKGIKFKSGDVIGIDVFSLQNSSDYWTRPEEFRPERFLENQIKLENYDNMLFLPFGSGPRSCIASRMALIQSKYLLAQIILNYEVYRTKKTNVPPKFIKHPQQAVYKSQFFGFKNRVTFKNN